MIEGWENTTSMPKKETPRKDLSVDYLATIRMPKGHWDVFKAYCTREDLTQKDAITRIFEQCIDRKAFEFIYGPGWKPEHS